MHSLAQAVVLCCPRVARAFVLLFILFRYSFIMAALDSTVYFNKRARELGLGDHIQGLANAGFNTMGSMAFAANYKPGNPDDSRFVAEVAQPILRNDVIRLQPSLIRLHFEAYAMLAQDVDEDMPALKLPGVERHARLTNVKQSLRAGHLRIS